ncbi:plasminogen-like [Haliotis rubra]|uniref:plasminogen-like n=1 Tax=Haliotis rubra TaxID=36100 RepID=UPI001EE53666|nr:plasminogen-like [Haliotis rubra]
MTCLLLLTALAVFCGSCQAATDCYTIVGRTAVYSGTTSVTTNNHTCQDWSSQSPNTHGYIDSYFTITNGDAGPGHAGASNYCRDPWGGSKRVSGYLWCYVASGNPRWEKCDVPKCPDTTTAAATTTSSVTTTASTTTASVTTTAAATTASATTAAATTTASATTTAAVTTTASATTTAAAATTGASAADCYTIVGRTAVYSGTTSVTTNNHTCQDWSSQSPNRHGYIDSYFTITNGDAGPGHAGASNYCRDPWGGSKRPSGYLWCYVASGNPRWERCDVPKCPDTTAI